jgi:hypothetical protein
MKKLLFLIVLLMFACSNGNDQSDDTLNTCIDETLIDLDAACFEIYEPVCGCDGVTYANSCVAINRNGVIAHEEGACDE